MNKNNIFETAAFLIKPQPGLSSLIFDENEVMHENIRQKLLNLAELFLDRTSNQLGGLEIKDICMAGSFASYFYHDNSDIDIIIITERSKNSFLSNNDDALFALLNEISHNFFKTCGMPKIGKTFVDIKLNNMLFNYVGKYSVLENRWIKHPDIHMTRNITADDLIDGYFQKNALIADFLKNIYTVNKKFDLTAYQSIKKLLKSISVNSLNEDESNLKDYLVQKVMLYDGKITDTDRLNRFSLCRSLSLVKEIEQ